MGHAATASSRAVTFSSAPNSAHSAMGGADGGLEQAIASTAGSEAGTRRTSESSVKGSCYVPPQ